jgi:hypothetical protein
VNHGCLKIIRYSKDNFKVKKHGNTWDSGVRCGALDVIFMSTLSLRYCIFVVEFGASREDMKE